MTKQEQTDTLSRQIFTLKTAMLEIDKMSQTLDKEVIARDQWPHVEDLRTETQVFITNADHNETELSLSLAAARNALDDVIGRAWVHMDMINA